MRVHIKLSTTLRDAVPGYAPTLGLDLDTDGPATAASVAEQIGLCPADIKIVMINGQRAPLDASLNDGDRVAFFPAVGGG